jgi:hypothetical protein
LSSSLPSRDKKIKEYETVLYGTGTLYLTEEYRLRAFKNRTLRTVLEPTGKVS